jgi:hypothetical protein
MEGTSPASNLMKITALGALGVRIDQLALAVSGLKKKRGGTEVIE